MIRAVILSSRTARKQFRQIAAFYLFRAELEAEYGFQFSECAPEAYCSGGLGGSDPRGDLVIYPFDGKDLPRASAQLAALRQHVRTPGIVLLDTADSTYARGFHLLPMVDLYVKGYLLRDLEQYGQRYLDGRAFADFIIRRHRLPHRFRGSGFAVDRVWQKAALGWNYSLRKDYLPYAVTPPSLDRGDRPIDVHCRVSVHMAQSRSWLSLHRQAALDAVAKLAPGARVVSSADRLPRDQCLQEVRQAKIVVSPFGWGEMCHRDHEAMANGALLVKPSMDHLETFPDLYRPGETYVALDWGMERLAETCRYYLEHDTERRAIAAAAWQRFTEHFRTRAFVVRVGEILRRLNLLDAALPGSNTGLY